MKKLAVFLLLITLLFTAACSAGTTVEEENGASVTQTAAPTEAPTEDPYAGWTLVFGKDVYIPNMPFADWAGQNQDNISCFTVFITSHDSAAFHAYAQSLNGFGYAIEQDSPYSYRGTDPEGRRIFLTDHENGHMEIAIYYNAN